MAARAFTNEMLAFDGLSIALENIRIGVRARLVFLCACSLILRTPILWLQRATQRGAAYETSSGGLPSATDCTLSRPGSGLAFKLASGCRVSELSLGQINREFSFDLSPHFSGQVAQEFEQVMTKLAVGNSGRQFSHDEFDDSADSWDEWDGLGARKERVTRTIRDGVSVVDLGAMDIWDGAELCLLRETLVHMVHTERHQTIGIDMKQVKFLPSGFFGMLYDWHERGIRVVLFAPQPQICNMLWFRQFFNRIEPVVSQTDAENTPAEVQAIFSMKDPALVAEPDEEDEHCRIADGVDDEADGVDDELDASVAFEEVGTGRAIEILQTNLQRVAG